MDDIPSEKYKVITIHTLKKLEIQLIEKISTCHFKNKEKDVQMYQKLAELHNSNTTDKIIHMLNHGYDTQSVETTNKLCSSYTNKGEIRSNKISLKT